MKMESKAICLILLAVAVTAQYNVSHLIDTTQHLQDLERGYDFRYENIYPQLNLTNDQNSVVTPNQTVTVPVQVPPKPSNVSQKALEKFINETLHNMPSGICVKEVP